jgi:hypothetical protein
MPKSLSESATVNIGFAKYALMTNYRPQFRDWSKFKIFVLTKYMNVL